MVLDFDELVVGFKSDLAGTVTTKRHRAKRRLITISSKVSWQCTNRCMQMFMYLFMATEIIVSYYIRYQEPDALWESKY